ncbi:MAG: TatD family hydrolase [Capnocytophaga sp.]|nr:TatD family hydrolase [Capnocytophaga sp.]
MILTDTHTHLYSEAFDNDRRQMIERALASGVSRFFIPAIDSGYTERMLDLERLFPENIFLMAGLHPTSVKENYRDELAHVAQLLAQRRFYAVGETGIDLYWDKTFLKAQQEAFSQQIRLARQYDLPIVIHCRDAFDEVFEVLESEKGEGLRGIFHCFSGDEKQAEKAIRYNLHLGIGGVVTFKSGKIDTFLKKIDLKHIVLETDSPYLAPVPYRGKRNESAYITEVLYKLSDIYSLPAEAIAKVTTHNSKEIFGI